MSVEPPRDSDRDGLSPTVREIVATVRARAATAATVDDIARIAGEATRRAEGNVRTTSEIRQLAAVAIAQASQVSDLLHRLAQLTDSEAPAGSGHEPGA